MNSPRFALDKDVLDRLRLRVILVGPAKAIDEETCKQAYHARKEFLKTTGIRPGLLVAYACSSSPTEDLIFLLLNWLRDIREDGRYSVVSDPVIHKLLELLRTLQREKR